MLSFDNLVILIGGFATLGIYTFFYKENPVYRFFEHIFIGIAAGFMPIYTFKSFLYPKLIEPLFGFNIIQYPDGTYSGTYNYYYLLYLFPALFGLLYYTLYSKRYSWMVKIVIGFSLGASAGLTFKGFFNEMTPQIASSFKSLIVLDGSEIDWLLSINNIFFVTTFFFVMYYFIFTHKKEGVVSEKVTVFGRYLMMVCFGAFFGSTVMARLVLLIERLQFILIDWAKVVKEIFIV